MRAYEDQLHNCPRGHLSLRLFSTARKICTFVAGLKYQLQNKLITYHLVIQMSPSTLEADPAYSQLLIPDLPRVAFTQSSGVTSKGI